MCRAWLFYSSAFFKMRLQYNTGTNKIYNGNIAYQTWTTQGSSAKTFTYLYDPLNRLTSGKSSDNNAERGIAYDPMGNITMLSRQVDNTLVDSLVYTYTSGTNKLANIIDKTASNTGLVSGTTNYSFDGNGNLAANSITTNTGQNKSFTYNLLNLPQVVTVPSGTITYTYDATGRKLRKVSVISGTTTTTEYIDGIQYKNSTTAIDFIQTEEGRAITSGSACDYYYNLIDHLGNTRVTFHTSGGAAIVQQADYLPFGVAINETSPVPNPKNEYLYNGKELQEELTQYDYGARLYDPLIGRWGVIDPLAEKSRRWSPYNYAEDNPVRFIDPDGMSIGERRAEFSTVAEMFADQEQAEIKNGTYNLDLTTGKLTNGYGGEVDLGNPSPKQNDDQKVTVGETDKKTYTAEVHSTRTHKKDVNQGGIDQKLADELDEIYPKKQGETEWHHIKPKYLGGDKNGPLVEIPAGYHQGITNEFRKEWGYGQDKPTDEQYDEIQKRVYGKFPIPGNNPLSRFSLPSFSINPTVLKIGLIIGVGALIIVTDGAAAPLLAL